MFCENGNMEILGNLEIINRKSQTADCWSAVRKCIEKSQNKIILYLFIIIIIIRIHEYYYY